MPLPDRAVFVEDADEDDLLVEARALLLVERVDADALGGRRRGHEGEFLALAGGDLFDARELAAADLLAGHGVGEDVVPVNLFDGLRAVVADGDFVVEGVARRRRARGT